MHMVARVQVTKMYGDDYFCLRLLDLALFGFDTLLPLDFWEGLLAFSLEFLMRCVISETRLLLYSVASSSSSFAVEVVAALSLCSAVSNFVCFPWKFSLLIVGSASLASPPRDLTRSLLSASCCFPWSLAALVAAASCPWAFFMYPCTRSSSVLIFAISSAESPTTLPYAKNSEFKTYAYVFVISSLVRSDPCSSSCSSSGFAASFSRRGLSASSCLRRLAMYGFTFLISWSIMCVVDAVRCGAVRCVGPL